MPKIFLIYALMICLFSCNEDNPGKVISAGDTASEEKRLRDNISAHPDSLLLKENLIQYFRDNGNYYNANKETDNAIQLDSLNPRLWDIKATLLFENGDTLGSIQAFEHAIELFPDPGYIISLGTLYAQTKNPKALELSDALLMANKAKADKESYFIKGLYYNYTNDKLKAISFFDKCISLSYTFMDAYREKAIALYDLGKYEEALAVLDKALTLQNNFEEGYYYSGRCLEKLNRKQDAILSYQNALVYDPNYIEAKDALAKLGVN
ncbi:MAG: tetratricopeptide repeat protein [Ferruginibacter sp.]